MTQTKQLSPLESVKNSLTQYAPEFAKALPSHIPVDKFIRVVQTAVAATPKLLEADRRSLFSACAKAASDGLYPDGREAALVSYGATVQYMPMIYGILKKIRNSGELHSITAQIVHKNDVFKFWVDTDGEHLNHEPMMFGDRGEIIGVYALAKCKDGIYFEVMTAEQIEQVKSVSRSKGQGPWKEWPEEMAKKTVLRRLSKRLPMSTDIDQLVRSEDEPMSDYLQQPSQQPETQTEKPKKKTRMEDIVLNSTDEQEAAIVEAPTKTVVIKPVQHSEDLPL